MGKNIFSIIIVSFFAFIAGFALLHKGLIPTHDGEYHVIRFFLFDEAIRDGNLYPRWAEHLNNGFGVPLFNFVYPLPNYIAALFHFVGVSFIGSFKLELFLAGIIGGIFFYLWSKEFWGKLGGMVSSVFYTFSPYHFVDIYIRGSVGEVWALAFFPAFLWSITRYIRHKQRIFFLLSPIFLSLIIFSHNILALMFFPFAISYILYLILKSKDKKFLIFNTSWIMILGLGISAIFWFPAITESKLATGLQIFDAYSHFPDLYQLLIPSWGSSFSGGEIASELSYQIGIANLLAIALSFAVVILLKKRKDKKSMHIIFFLILFSVVFFLMLSISEPVWKIVPLMNYFQFPWRLLSIEILITSFTAGSIVFLFKNKIVKILIAVFLSFLAFILGIGYAKPAYYLYRDDSYYLTRSNFIDGTNSPGNVFNTVWFDTKLKKVNNKLVFIKGSGTIKITEANGSQYKATINSLEDSQIIVNTAYFPIWSVYVDNEKVRVLGTANGLFSFNVPAGKHDILIKFEDTYSRKAGTLVFYLSSLIVIVLFGRVLFATIRK